MWPGDEKWAAYRPARHRLLLGAILVVATGLRWVGVSRWSLWLDEIYSASLRSQAPLQDLLYLPYDPHPPLYFLLVRGVTTVFGTDPVSVRSLSVVLSVAAVFGMYVLGRELYDIRTGLFAATLFAVSTTQIHFGRNARMYPLFVLLTIGSIYYLVRAGEGDKHALGGYVVTTTLLLYTHIYGIFVLLGQYTILLVRDRFLTEISVRRWIGMQAIVGALFLPWAVVLGRQFLTLIFGGSETEVAIGWIPEASLGLLRNTAYLIAGSPWELYPIVSGDGSTNAIALGILVIGGITSGIALSSIGTAGNRSDAELGLGLLPEGGLLVGIALAIIGVPFLVSVLLEPIYFPRFTVPAMVPLVLLVAHGIRRLELPSLTVPILLVLVGSSLVLTATYYDGTTQEPWADAVSTVETNTDDGDLIIVQPGYAGDFFPYYYTESATVRRATAEGAIIGGGVEGSTASDSPLPGEQSSVCLFQYGNPPPKTPEVLQIGEVETTETFDQGVLRVECFERSDTAS